MIPVLLPGAISDPELPPLLESFLWVDLRPFSAENPEPLANLVAGILGRRPREMEPGRLAEQVAAILSAPTESPGPPIEERVVLAIDRPSLNDLELEAVRQQMARLLGVSAEHVKVLAMQKGSVKIVLELSDLRAVSQLFAMVHRSDPGLQEFFQRCHISHEAFEHDNSAAAHRVREAIQARQILADELPKIAAMSSVPMKELVAWTQGTVSLPVAIVATDIVDSSRLGNDLGDATWESIRQQHFAKAVSLVHQGTGLVVTNTGDGMIALFHDTETAILFALGLYSNSGHAVVRARIGVHTGQLSVAGDDTFGRDVGLAARITGAIKAGGVVVSDRAKQDIVVRSAALANKLHWNAVNSSPLKGFEGPLTLWSVHERTD